MSFVKNKLKLARDALSKKDYVKARDAAAQVLEDEPDNYNANVFLGLASLELGQHEKSEQAYRNAIQLNRDQALAWQGISKFYERMEKWEAFADTLQHLMQIHASADDAVRCAEAWQKLIELRRERGTSLQLFDALSLILPQSSLYPVLATLPLPDPTNPTLTATYVAQTAILNSLPVLEQLITLLESYEDQYLIKEVEKRRTRLGSSRPEILKNEVGMEIWATSRLPGLYNEVLMHPSTGDDLRRQTESKLIRYKQRYLYAIPDTEKSASAKTVALKELDELVNGVVLLGIPDELAWTIFLEGQDCDNIAAYDRALMRQFMALFSTSPIALLLGGYFSYIGVPIADEEGKPLIVLEDDPFDTIINAFSAAPASIIASRILAYLYLNELDYPNAIKVAESGLEFLHRAESSTGRKLPRVRIGFQATLATSLVHLFPPKHHARALLIIEEVLSQSPDNVACLMGHAYVLQAAKRWKDASVLFAKVDNLLQNDLEIGLRAQEENAWCLCQIQDFETGLQGLLGVHETLQTLDDRKLDIARCLWRLGKCYWDIGDSRREDAYGYFIASLKSNATYPPAFTSLGIYYSEYASPRDAIRASKCFQKAFELDPREAFAARKLAEGFAEDREWDLVEVVAQRTIEGEGGLDAGIKGAWAEPATRYLPTNAWAWKALGIIELNRRNHPPAIRAFQIALRGEPEDQMSWLRLGEAYNKDGRHGAALKALARAHELKPDDWMCSYLIADVHQHMGHFEDAIAAFELILKKRPSEVGVLLSLGEAYLKLGCTELSEKFQARAEHSFVSCIRVCVKTIQESPGFRSLLWKTMADAIFYLSSKPMLSDEEDVRRTLDAVMSILPAKSDYLPDFMSPSSLQNESMLDGTKALEIAITAYSYRISLCSSESVATGGSTWFDLGVALHVWATKSSSSENGESARAKAVSCFNQALREDPRNVIYWIAMGDAHFLSHAKTAQHAYVKALDIESKNVVAWTNLGLLYLHHNDVELANEVLYRAQTLDPDHEAAWIGQALVATANNHDTEADAMFEHAIGLTASTPDTDLQFASRAFSRLRSIIGYDKATLLDALLPAFSVLARYCEHYPYDASGLHLFGLICESLGHPEWGITMIARVIAILESAYEVAEDPEVERRFTIANSNLARLRLSLGDYQGAVESFESALGLLGELSDHTSEVLRIQAHFGLGIANFMQGHLQSALGLFEVALESASNDLAARGQVSVLHAQTMWAIQTEEFKETAKARLLECIAADPENLTAINTLAGMGILTDDDSLVDAALSELLTLPLERRHELDPRRDANYVLIQHHLGQNDATKALSVAQRAVHAEPSRHEHRNELASMMLQNGRCNTSLSVLAGTISNDLHALPTSLILRAIAFAMDGTRHETYPARREIQRAIMLSPSNIRLWTALAYVRSRAEVTALKG